MSQHAIVETARGNLRRALAEGDTGRLPDAGRRWENFCSHSRLMIARFQDAGEVIRYAQSPNAGFETRHVGQALIDYVSVIDRLCAETFPQFEPFFTSFAETPLSVPETTTTLRGRLVSSPLQWHMMVLLRCLSLGRPHSVLEIGGGFGGPARQWMTNGLHRPQLYVSVDFPESLFYAEVYLRSAAPEIELVYLHERAEKPPLSRPSIVLCPIANIDLLLEWPIDLILNTGSMQEMSDDYVSFYMAKIQRLKSDRFYSFNYFAEPLNGRPEAMNCAAPVPGRDWSTEFQEYRDWGSVGTAERLFARTGAGPEAIAAAEAAVAAGPPADNAAFLALFDAVRRVERGPLLMDAAANAILGLPYIPRETLYLARHADCGSPAGKVVLRMLEKMAVAGNQYAVQEAATQGSVTEGAVIVDGVEYPLSDSYGGSIETVMELENAIEAGGWAGETSKNAPVTHVVAAVGATIVAKTAPVGVRPDIEAGYGAGLRPAQFTIRIPLPEPPPEPLDIRLFGLTRDGNAVRLAGVLGDARMTPAVSEPQPPAPAEPIPGAVERRFRFWRTRR